MKTAELKILPVSVLKPAEYNPRKKLKKGDKEYKKIADSIREFGFADPLVVNADMTIIGGHQRLTVAIDLGYTEVPCAVVDVDKTREKALNIALNKITGQWDEALLADLLKDLGDKDFNLEFTGFDAPEIEQLFSNIYDKQVKEDDFDIDKAMEEPSFTKPGDLWMLGKHKVLCGDSTEAASYEKLLGDEKVNLVLSDLPYFVSYKGTAGTIKNDDLDDEAALDFTLKAMNCMHDAMADDASIYIFHSDSKGLIFRKAFDQAGFYLSSCCIWKKDSLVLGRSPYQWITESILYGWKKKGKHCWYSGRKETNCWEFPKPKKNAAHPTAKPIPLMAYPIKNSTMTNGIVLDPFLGSGATLIACEETDRVCRGIELDVKYMDVIVRRFCQHAGGKLDGVKVLRDGQILTLEEVLLSLDTPINLEDFKSGVDGAKAVKK